VCSVDGGSLVYGKKFTVCTVYNNLYGNVLGD